MVKVTGATVKDVEPEKFIKAYAAHLKRTGKMAVPKWVDIVKTASYKELPPADEDWYYIRSASLARKVYLRKGTGVGAFRKVYGGGANLGVHKSHFAKASGNVIRSCLSNLETIGVIAKPEDGSGGREITSKGQQDLDRIAGQIAMEGQDDEESEDEDEDE